MLEFPATDDEQQQQGNADAGQEHVTSPLLSLEIPRNCSQGSNLLGEAISDEENSPGISQKRDTVATEESQGNSPQEATGRPPLLPPRHSNRRTGAGDSIRHDREKSNGDDSFLSGLTEDPASPRVSQRGHKRGVSWDVGVPVVEPSSKFVSSKILSVADLHADSPLEAEAETSILKAIEEREHETVSIFANVPDSAVESFQVKNDAKMASVAQSLMSQRGHRRIPTQVTRKSSATLESTLVGLTNRIRDMHDRSDGVDTTKSDYPPVPVVSTRTSTRVDHGTSLLNDANVLFRRNLKKERSSRNLEFVHTTSGWTDDEPQDNEPIGVRASSMTGAEVDLEKGGDMSEPAQDEDKKKRGYFCSWFCCRERQAGGAVMEDWRTFSDFIRPRRSSFMVQVSTAMFAFIIPCAVVALVLFRGFDNPMLGKYGASISWFVLFLARHAITLIFAKITEILLIDLVVLNTQCVVRALGPFPSLWLAQSKGFPFILTTWSFYSYLMLSGNNRFAKHWLFYQNFMPLFNETNPAGTMTDSRMNYLVLGIAFALGIVVTVKRIVLGFHYGSRIYLHYGDSLAKVIQKILLVGEVAALARDFELGIGLEDLDRRAEILALNTGPNDVDVKSWDGSNMDSISSKGAESTRRDKYTGSLTQSQRNELFAMLESWEEPETEKKAKTEASIGAILQFRQALLLTTNDFPFSTAFGLADTREHCIESSQLVYDRLLQRQSQKDVLDFDTIALLATTDDSGIDTDKMKELIHVFRPQRDGTLTMIDFVKSVDKIYKRLRLLSASIANAAQIDHASEKIFNVIFYAVIAIIIVSILGFDPLALFISLSTIILAFGFMISNASARWFDGMLFVLVRRPYDIGDRIHVSPADQETSPNGSSTWFVEQVDLFTTTYRFATTNEVATVSNGSLANSRVINAARSPKMLGYVFMRFGVDVPYQKVKLFRMTVEEFVKQRPRDWLSMVGFRATRVEHEQGFIEYVMVLQHRERWQNVVAMLNAKAEFSSFALEVAKKLDMHYRAPALPVDLNMAGSRDALLNRTKEEASADSNLEAMMRSSSDRTAPDMSDVAALFGATASPDSVRKQMRRHYT